MLPMLLPGARGCERQSLRGGVEPGPFALYVVGVGLSPFIAL